MLPLLQITNTFIGTGIVLSPAGDCQDMVRGRDGKKIRKNKKAQGKKKVVNRELNYRKEKGTNGKEERKKEYNTCKNRKDTKSTY